MNKLCCELNTWLVCDGCEWKTCYFCSDLPPDKAPWDFHNEVSPTCYVAKLARKSVGSVVDPNRSGVHIMCEVVF